MNVVFDVEMYIHRRALIFPYPFELHATGAARFEMHTIQLVGGAVANKVVRDRILEHSNILAILRQCLRPRAFTYQYNSSQSREYPSGKATIRLQPGVRPHRAKLGDYPSSTRLTPAVDESIRLQRAYQSGPL